MTLEEAKQLLRTNNIEFEMLEFSKEAEYWHHILMRQPLLYHLYPPCSFPNDKILIKDSKNFIVLLRVICYNKLGEKSEKYILKKRRIL